MKYNKSLVSVITPMYNASSVIERCILSVQSQSYKFIEHIIIDDCSRDDSYKIALDLSKKYKKITVLRNKNNSGPAKSRNHGLVYSKARYIAFLDSDDFWHHEKINKQLLLLKKYKAPISCTSYYHYLNDKVIRSININRKFISYNSLLYTNSIYTSSVLVDRAITGDFYMPDYYYDDFVCWLKITKDFGDCVVVNDELMYYSLSENSVSSNKIKSAIKVYFIYRNFLKFNILKTIYYMFFYAIFGFLKHKSLK